MHWSNADHNGHQDRIARYVCNKLYGSHALHMQNGLEDVLTIASREYDSQLMVVSPCNRLRNIEAGSGQVIG